MFSSLIALLLALAPLQVSSFTLKVTNDWSHHQQCIGMNGGQDFGRRVQSSISLISENAVGDPVLDGNVSIVMFELRDEKLGGIKTSDGKKEYYCTSENVAARLCAAEEMGEFLISPAAHAAAVNPIVTRSQHLHEPMFTLYQVNQPGYFCVASFSPTGSAFSLIMDVTDQGHALPAFRQRTLKIYRWIVPIFLALLVIWNYSWIIQRRLSAPASIHVLIWLSAVGSAARWIALELFDRHMTPRNSLPKLLASTSFLIVLQNIMLVVAAISSVGLHLDTKIPRATVSIFCGAFAVWSAIAAAIDAQVDDADRTPLLVTAMIGFLGAMASFWAVFALLRNRKSVTRSYETPRRVLLAGLGFLGTFYATLALLNAYTFLFESSTGHLFGSQFWVWRSLWMDVPYEFINLAFVPIVMVQYIS